MNNDDWMFNKAKELCDKWGEDLKRKEKERQHNQPTDLNIFIAIGLLLVVMIIFGGTILLKLFIDFLIK